ncbi:restriction endonuclease subunit S [Clostridium chromiireducens]|uniref:Restriction endonuclease subunit S n=1 Tax=Clostridium chromiireducens TaxID=225345 RepID=A0A964RRL1_9CLOT|nr:restriction endonuclease subunit S [Clostridium chromiireducens]MVX66574.1 restriction endonuclease subunit S [Clostridium chromiireducens]
MTRKMKDSGVEWIGEIPDSWKKMCLKNVIDYVVDNRGKTPPLSEIGIPMLEIDGLTSKYPDTSKVNKFLSQETYNNFLRKYLKSGDILFATVGATIGKTSIVPEKFNYCIAQNIVGFRPNSNQCNLFWLYYMKSELFKIMYLQFNKGNTIDSIKISSLMNGIVVVPEKCEQEKVADYLDEKCSKIDQTIEKQKQVIEKLKEYKQSIITEAVTKGLNPDVKMKDSGVEWIGEIPEHWKVKRLRYIARCQNGISKSAECFGSGFPFVSYGDVYRNIELPNNIEGLVESSESDRKIYSVEEGDIFFTRTSETIEEIGLTCVCKNTIKNATFAGFLIRVRPIDHSIDVNYSKYYFSSNVHRKFFVKEMNLVIRASLSQELLKKLPVLLPSIEEQIEIANYLDKKCTAIDKSISQKEKLIEKLTEYKKSLIYECVTGKREV